MKKYVSAPWCYNIAIIWWTSWFWKWLAWFLMKNIDYKIFITVTWTNNSKWQKALEFLEDINKKLNKNWKDSIEISFIKDNIKAIKDADVIVYSVPISITEKIIKETAEYIKKDAIVLDVTSVKQLPSNAINKYSINKPLIIPTHPMFWPYCSSIEWQVIVLTPEKDSLDDERFKLIKKWLKNKWAKVLVTDAQTHDKTMSIVQWLTHFTMFAFAKTLYKLNSNVEESLNFVSPIYKLMLSSVSRYVWHNPALYANIQLNNSEIPKVQKAFIESVKELSNITDNKDFKWFNEYVLDMQDYFEKDSVRWQKYTDKIIYLISEESKKLHSRKWENITIKNIYSNEIISWILDKLEKENIYLNKNIYNINEWLLQTN